MRKNNFQKDLTLIFLLGALFLFFGCKENIREKKPPSYYKANTSKQKEIPQWTIDFESTNYTQSYNTGITPDDLVSIGYQTWTNKNADIITYRNGDTIPQIQNLDEWKSTKEGAWCYISDDPDYGKKYGKLYNGYAITDPRGFAPKGFHIPSNDEWLNLFYILGGRDIAGNKMKSTSGWILNENGTNSSGFNGLPNGTISMGTGDFREKVGESAMYWGISKTDKSLWAAALTYDDQAGWFNIDKKNRGYSVRFIKDENENFEDIHSEEDQTELSIDDKSHRKSYTGSIFENPMEVVIYLMNKDFTDSDGIKTIDIRNGYVGINKAPVYKITEIVVKGETTAAIKGESLKDSNEVIDIHVDADKDCIYITGTSFCF